MLCIPHRSCDLFHVVEQHDLEGIVAKRKANPYTPGAHWFKVKNPTYSQGGGRGELFQRQSATIRS
jgi:ATP-dependent DNA ligase